MAVPTCWHLLRCPSKALVCIASTLHNSLMTAKSTTRGVQTLGLRVDSRTSEKPDSPPEGTCSFRHAFALHQAAQGTCKEADGKMLLVPQASMDGLSLATDSFHVDHARAWALANKVLLLLTCGHV